MNRKILGLTLLITTFAFASVEGQMQNNPTEVHQEKKTQNPAGRYTQIGEQLPFFRVRNHDGKIIKHEDLMNDQKTFIVLFNPTCGSCIELGNTFMKHEKEFKAYNVVFVAAPGMEGYLDYFFERNQLNQSKNIYVGIDESNLALDINIRDGMPQVNIYEPGLILEKIYTGNIPYEYLKNHF